MKTFGWVIGILMFVTIISAVITTCNTAQKFNEDAQNTVFNEYSASSLLKKYEWFKDASAQLDAKTANIKAYESRFSAMEKAYNGVPRNKWNRNDIEQFNQWESELSGLKSNYNDLAAEYNSAMAKFNYRFCNVGELPKGANEVLPREYKQYLEN